MTGVDKYLKKQSIADKDKPAVTGVAKYMAKNAFIARVIPLAPKAEKALEGEFISAREAVTVLPAGSGGNPENSVITTIDPVVVTGVAKYIARQSSSEVAADAPVLLTGVAKYIASHVAEATQPQALSGVEKYLRRQG